MLGDRPIAFHPAFARIAGSVHGGLFLSQLFYWMGKGADPDGWIYKTRDEWQAETYLTRYEQETARRDLRELGVLEEKLAGLPARLYYRVNSERLLELLDSAYSSVGDSTNQESGNPTNLLGENHPTCMGENHQLSIYTEITTETTVYESPADAGCADAHDPPLSPPAEKKRSTKVSDPRSKDPAIRCVRSMMNNRYPPIELYDEIIATLGEAPDADHLARCRREWVARGYNPNGWGWLREWYKEGIPKLQTRGKPQEPESVGGMRRWG
jgi:hypothetical protein